MLILKIMSDEDLPDSDCNKNFALKCIGPGDELNFIPDDGYTDTSIHVLAQIIRRETGDSEIYPLTGNAYVMNLQGKTIATRWVGTQFI